MAKKMQQKNPAVKWFVVTAVISVVLLAGYSMTITQVAESSRAEPMGLLPGDLTGSAPSLQLADLHGKQVSLADFKGKVVILDFWATWCPPCKMEIPDFIEIESEFGARGVQIIGVALDQPGRTREFAESHGMNYPVLVGNDDVAARFGGISGIPTTFIIDRSGRIVQRFEGYRPKQTFVDEVAKLL